MDKIDPKTWISIITIVLFLVSSVYAGYQRNSAIEARAEADRMKLEKKIDEPYQKRYKEAMKKITLLKANIEKYKSDITESEQQIVDHEVLIADLATDLAELQKSPVDLAVIKRELKDADIDAICSEFTSLGFPCTIVSTCRE